ncbi:hypothetical protein [Glycomyces terrestris]|uniref:Uncharacterized protein n=1 Tax=Glycomyces terrestris TaxID=2493553 RepID=A0A426UUH3_9ACTN|nr:hypothetical protein [Glycomyces terrestris]RRR97587.1 hypothetical protein EIW28_19565 [Glycomyces terrestris]
MRRTALPLLALPLLLTACTAEEPAEVTDEDVARIEQAIVNGSETAWELVLLEQRIGSLCMQDHGFTVHDPLALSGNTIPDRFTGFASPYARIPTVEQAERFGFAMWPFFLDTPAAEEMRADPEFIAFTADDQGWWDPSFDEGGAEFDAQTEEYREEWERAFMGDERYEYQQAASEAFEAGDDGFDLEQPPFGGCELETITAVYGEPELHEGEDGDYWVEPGPGESPLTSVGDGELYAELSEDYADEEEAFLDCLVDGGYEGFEFDEYGWLDTYDFIANGVFDAGLTAELDGEEVVVPEIPDEVRDRTDDPQALETTIALDFARCAEDAGLRDGPEEDWARMYTERLIGKETEIVAWQEEIDGYFANAQAYIEGE